MQPTGSRPRVCVTADGRGVVGHAGTRLLADVADVTGLTSGFSDALRVAGRRAGGHDPGRVAVDVAVMLADGGEAITDLAVLRGVPELFGPVASDATVWRVLDGIDDVRAGPAAGCAGRGAGAGLGAAGRDPRRPAGRRGRADVRCRAWSSTSTPPLWSPTPRRSRPHRRGRRRSATTRCSLSATTPARPWPGSCARGGPGRTPPPTTSPSSTRPWPRSPTRTATASTCSSAPTPPAARTAFLAHIRGLRGPGCDTFFSVGVPVTEAIRDAITRGHRLDPGAGRRRRACATAPRSSRSPTSSHRPSWHAFPAGTRLIVRRERPHPGAQLDLFDTVEGLRHQVIATDTPRRRRLDPVPRGPPPRPRPRRGPHPLRQRHRLRPVPVPRYFAINAAWLELALTACDLLAWTQLLLLRRRTGHRRTETAALPAAARRRPHHPRRPTHPTCASPRPGPGPPTSPDAFARLAALPRPAT